MPRVANTIRRFVGALAGRGDTEQERARNQLEGHLEPDLLEHFFQRTLSPEQYQTVIEHLNECDPCREAIALVLLAVEDPKMAAELELERKRRSQEEPVVWWKQALQWSLVVVLVLILIVGVVLVPQSKDPDSRVGRWVEETDKSAGRLFGGAEDSRSSSTSFGHMVRSTYDEPKPVRRSVLQPGWDTGPAPYVGRVIPSAPYKEVDISVDRAEQQTRTTVATAAAAVAPTRVAVPSAATARRRLVVGSEGELKRTLDGGETWQNVTVGPNLVFRSLALSGRTVWAAGNTGALYRSFDAAEHWQQVNLSYRGEPITDDLVEIHFSDPQHGIIRGATGREWTTVDGGNQWLLNPFSTAAK